MSRAVERDRAKAQAAEAELEDVRVTLVSDIASAYVNLRDQQARLTLARAIQDHQADRLSLIQQRRQAGAVTAQDLITAEADVDQAQADRIQLESDVELSLNQLAVLVGREPGALDQDLARPAPIPLPPAEVAVGDPAGLLARRPDVRQAERKLAAATAAIGVATSQ